MSKTITLPTELLRDAISTALRINAAEIGIGRECLATAIMSDLEEAALPPLTEESTDWIATTIQDEIAADEAMAELGEYGGEPWGAETITTAEPTGLAPLSPAVRRFAQRLNELDNHEIEFGIGRVPSAGLVRQSELRLS